MSQFISACGDMRKALCGGFTIEFCSRIEQVLLIQIGVIAMYWHYLALVLSVDVVTK
ncbi:hypothetical protein WD277_11480 [Pseudomonas fragi]|uniref:hypothetical protein n=1 Tax=Pseudomonas fragi TaxID=296 RepID=UPI0030B5783D